MVKTILLLQKAGFINQKFSTPEVHQAVALWWGLTAETVRRRCIGDVSLGKKGKWDWAMERAGTHGKNPRELIPTDMFHADVPRDYSSVVMERFTRGNGNPLPNGRAAVIRIPGSYWAVAKDIFISNKKSMHFFGYWLIDCSKVLGTEIQSSTLDLEIARDILGFWIYEKDIIPTLSPDAVRWLDSFAPIQPEAGQK
jgi:hypothetical protein